MPFFGVPIRNGLPIGLGSVAGFGVQQFDPSQLFEGGTVAGAWYDPSDLSTMFTTSAGTTPVAMPGQGAAVSVGLMLDKSQGLVLGPEVVVSPLAGTFGASWSISGDTIVRNGSTGTAVLNPVGGVIPSTSKTYLVTFTASGVTGDSVAVRVGGGTAYGPFAGNGTFTLRVPGGGITGAITFLPFAGGAATATYSNISVRELPGNHAISFNNTTARPELRARVNLLTYSEEFDNAAWTKGDTSVTQNTIVAPDGTLTADTLTESATSARHWIVRDVSTVSANSTFTFSITVKKKDRRYCFITLNSASGVYRYSPIFDLDTGSTVAVNTTGTTSGTSNSIVDLGDGWFRISASGTNGATGFTEAAFGLSNSATPSLLVSSPTYTGDGTSGIYIWGADLRPANIGANVPAYQRIADANTYDASGFPLYLRFDGIDDSMYTPANLNLSGTDKVSVFAGVRKLSDAANGKVVELSVNSGLNNGTFHIDAPAGGGNTGFSFRSRGTIAADPFVTSPVAPTTQVVTGIGNISGDSAILRLNGSQVAQITTDQGTGNFGTYPLYIGSRANSSLWLNGHLHSLIIAGSAVSAGNISATEQWVAGKTGIQI